MDEQDLWASIVADKKVLRSMVDELSQAWTDQAETEDAYRRIKAIAKTEERAKGMPVSMLDDAIFLREEVREAKKARDIALGVVDACHEGINSLKLQIRVTDDQLQREWNQSGTRD